VLDEHLSIGSKPPFVGYGRDNGRYGVRNHVHVHNMQSRRARKTT
jgi:altronate dehydratase